MRVVFHTLRTLRQKFFAKVINGLSGTVYGAKYLKTDQVKFMEDSL